MTEFTLHLQKVALCLGQSSGDLTLVLGLHPVESDDLKLGFFLCWIRQLDQSSHSKDNRLQEWGKLQELKMGKKMEEFFWEMVGLEKDHKPCTLEVTHPECRVWALGSSTLEARRSKVEICSALQERARALVWLDRKTMWALLGCDDWKQPYLTNVCHTLCRRYKRSTNNVVNTTSDVSLGNISFKQSWCYS